MSATGTTIAGAMKAGASAVTLTAYTAPALGTGVNAGNKVLRIDGEWMRITDDSNAPTVKVTRGEFGTGATAHDVLATAVYGLTSDMTSINSIIGGNIVSVGQNGVIAVPTTPSNVETLIFLNKATALATTTLAAPGLDQDGMFITITSSTAAAHVITATSLVADAVTGSPHTTMTFAAFKGASITLQADRGLYNVISTTGVTIT